MENRPQNGTYRRLALTLVYTIAVAGSLVVFPSALPAMVAGWVLIASIQFARRHNGWLPLVLCSGVLVAKQPDWSPWLVGFLLAAIIGVCVSFLRQRKSAWSNGSKLGFLAMVAIWTTWLAWTWESHVGAHCSNVLALDPSQSIVCVGDSLTTGLASNEAYPEYLQQLVKAPVVNWGRAGVTARDMVKHLPEILADNPQLVVVELGGHDFLRGYGREATRESLVTLIEACRDAGAAVVLVEIPRGFITDPFRGLERELAREYDLELIPDSAIRMLVVRSPVIPMVGDFAKPHLSDDGLHPNVAGAEYLAKCVFAALRRVFGQHQLSAEVHKNST
jgi:acyl-CoA thioesterase-1